MVLIHIGNPFNKFEIRSMFTCNTQVGEQMPEVGTIIENKIC